MQGLHEQIAATVLSGFKALPKTGKPQLFEHTILAGKSLPQLLHTDNAWP